MMARGSGETRLQIIQAANELFYGEGIRSASVDAIAAKAGITKRTLYYHFRSKDHLIEAYLEARDLPTLERYQRWLGDTEGSLAEQIAGVFNKLAHAAENPNWKGCGFLRAAAEFASTPGHPALKIGAAHKKRFEAWLADRIAAEHLPEPLLRARQLLILLDGAVAEMLIHRDPSYARTAGQLAKHLLTRDPVEESRRHASAMYTD
jgi:AcrR family transcriptional regulator